MTRSTPSAGATRTRHVTLGGPRTLEVVEETLPALRSDWVRVRFTYCGVCGTDVSRFEGRRPAPYPVSMGHEWVAVVEVTGCEVPGILPGDTVTTDLNFRCGTCAQCRRRRSHLCESGQHGYFTNRGFGLRADIHASYLVRCEGAPTPRLALAEPLSCALHAARSATIAPDDRVLVIGAGGIGMCMAFLLAHVGSTAQFDIADLDELRLKRLEPLIEPKGTITQRPISGGYDVVLDTSGTADGLSAACDLVAAGGRLCTMSHLPTDQADGFRLEDIIHKDLTFNLSYLNGERSNLERAVSLLERFWDDRWDDLLELRPLSDLEDALAHRSQSRHNKTIIDVREDPPGEDR